MACFGLALVAGAADEVLNQIFIVGGDYAELARCWRS
jgi:hypothetical protein